jgi:hypothetical protein
MMLCFLCPVVSTLRSTDCTVVVSVLLILTCMLCCCAALLCLSGFWFLILDFQNFKSPKEGISHILFPAELFLVCWASGNDGLRNALQ